MIPGCQSVDKYTTTSVRSALKWTSIFSVLSDLGIPFSQWSKQQVCGWLEDYGLGQYVNLSRHWVESGQTLLSATPQEMEKVRDQTGESPFRSPSKKQTKHLLASLFTAPGHYCKCNKEARGKTVSMYM